MTNKGAGSLAKSLKRERRRGEPLFFLILKVASIMLLPSGEPDPEGRGRGGYVPLVVIPMIPFTFNMQVPRVANSRRYMFMSLSHAGSITILVFFADNGDLTRAYWFAVAQEADVVAGGAVGKAKSDGTGMGDGAQNTRCKTNCINSSMVKKHQMMNVLIVIEM